MVEAPTAPTDPEGSGHPRARRAFLLLAVVAGLGLAAGAGVSIATIRHVEGTIIKIGVGPTCKGNCLHDIKQKCAQDICDFLILGSDTRAGLSKGQQSQFGNTKTVGGQRADTIILVRVDPVHNRTVVFVAPARPVGEHPGPRDGQDQYGFRLRPRTPWSRPLRR